MGCCQRHHRFPPHPPASFPLRHAPGPPALWSGGTRRESQPVSRKISVGALPRDRAFLPGRTPTLISRAAVACRMPQASLLDWLYAYPWLIPLWGAGLSLLAAYLVYSTRKLWSLYQDIRAGWHRWDTYPVPDTKACKHIAAFLLFVSVDLLLIALYLYLTMGGPAQNPLV